jgi:16S rRNA (cytidine1402-2'-O)-methyltransferase
MTNPGVLSIVATPIGNLDDMSSRAQQVLASVDLIAAEDTRHSQKLLAHFGIQKKMLPYHDHNDDKQSLVLLERLESGQNIALISDAGTPLISDPGYRLVRMARAHGIQVTPIPGASAPIAALSAAGVATDRFSFEGFLPAKSAARRKVFNALLNEQRTMVFFESPHRVLESLRDAVAVFGESRDAVFVRELSKTFETFIADSLSAILKVVEADDNQRRGEIVLIITGAEKSTESAVLSDEQEHCLRVLAAELPTKQAAGLASSITGVPKKRLYQRALELKDEHPPAK